MKRVLFLATFLIGISAAAQTQTYKVEVTDNTQIQMMSAEYLLYQKEQRERQAAINLGVARENYRVVNYDLTMLAQRTTDPDIRKRIEKLFKDNERLLRLANKRNYNVLSQKIQTEMQIINISVK